MNVKKEIVHYLSKSQNHITRRKDVLSFKYKDYELHILKETKHDASYILIKDKNGEFWMFYNFYISYDMFDKTINNLVEDFDKKRHIVYCDYQLEQIKKYYDNFIDNIKNRINKNKYFNIIELEYLNKNHPELYPEAVKSREKYLEDKRTKEQEEQKEREEYRKNTVKNKNKEFFDKIWSMKTAIHEGKVVLSKAYEYYKDDDYYKKTIQNNFLYLFKEYNINVPLATQGFINNNLYSYDFGSNQSKSWVKYNGTTMYDNFIKLKEVIDKELSKTKENEFEIEMEVN